LRADAIQQLGEGELAVVSSVSRNFLWEPDASELYARRNYQAHPNSVWSALEYANALAGNGKFLEARRLVKVLDGLSGQEKGKWAPEIAQAKHRVGTKTWEFKFLLDRAKFPRSYSRERFDKNGYFEFSCLPDTPYQKTTFVVTGAAKNDEVKDTGGNRVLRIWPNGKAPVFLSLTIKMQPWRFDFLKNARGGYVVPDDVKPYLGKTVLNDPTTARMQAVGKQLIGKNRGETIRNAVNWMDKNFLNVAGGTPENDQFDKRFGVGKCLGKPGVEWNTDALLDYCVGHCWEHSRLLAGILRAAGIAARQRLVLLQEQDAKDPSGWMIGWHLIAEYYEPKVGWVMLENGREFAPGTCPDAMIPMMAEIPDQTDEREKTEPWPLVSVDKGWRLVWFGNKSIDDPNLAHVERKLSRVSLDDAYPWR